MDEKARFGVSVRIRNVFAEGELHAEAVGGILSGRFRGG